MINENAEYYVLFTTITGLAYIFLIGKENIILHFFNWIFIGDYCRRLCDA